MSTITELIKHDHEEVRDYYNKFKASHSPDEKRKWFNLMAYELSRHSVSEELTIYSDMETLGFDGKMRANEARDEHHKVKEFLMSLQGKDTGDEFDRIIDIMMKDLYKHMEKEEAYDGDLAFYEGKKSREELIEAGKRFQMYKKMAPTNPHTMVSESLPTLEAAVGLLLLPIDKVRDMFKDFPDNA